MTEVYEIDLTKKYILKFPNPLSDAQIEHICREIDEWKNSDSVFLIIDADVQLVKIDNPTEELWKQI